MTKLKLQLVWERLRRWILRQTACRWRGHDWSGLNDLSRDSEGRFLRFGCDRCGQGGRLSVRGGIESCRPDDPTISYGAVAYRQYQDRHPQEPYALRQRGALKAYMEAEPPAKRHCISKQPPIRKSVGPKRIAEIIQKEELAYHKLLNKAPEIVKKAFPPGSEPPTAADLAKLWDEQGIDPETVLTILGVRYRGDPMMEGSFKDALRARQAKQASFGIRKNP